MLFVAAEPVFPSSLSLSATKATVSVCDLELRPMTLTDENEPHRIKLNHHIKHLHTSKVIWFESHWLDWTQTESHTHTHTHYIDCSTRTTKWSLITSGQSNLTKRPHSRRTWPVQLYSLPGANLHSNQTHASLDPPESTSQTTFRSVQSSLQGSWLFQFNKCKKTIVL